MILDYQILKHHTINKITLVPQKYLHMIKDFDMHLALACFINKEGYEKYTEFYMGGKEGRKKDSFLILDNGVIEGDPIAFPNCLEIAKQINANEIVLPDVYKDSKATEAAIEEAVAFIENLSVFEKNRFQFMMVPQGKSFGEWLDSAQFLMNKYKDHKYIKTLGVPRHLQQLMDVNIRLYAIEELYNRMYTELLRYNIHFLGAGITTEELFEYDLRQYHKYLPPVRSVDSALAYVFAKENIPYAPDVFRPNFDPIDFKDGTCDDEELLSINIFNWRNSPPVRVVEG